MIADFEDEEVEFDRMFDPFLRIRRTAGWLEWLEGRLDLDLPRQRRLSEDTIRKRRQVLVAVLANLCRAASDPVEPAVFFSRKTGEYTEGPYVPPFLSYRLTVGKYGVIPALERLGFITTEPGRWGYGFKNAGRRSTMRPTEQLLGAFAAGGIHAYHVSRDDDLAPVLILKDSEKSLQTYRLNDQLRAIDTAVRAYNGFLKRQRLSLDVTETEWREILADRDSKGRPRPPPRFDQVQLRRFFNLGRWDRGGRFYGGWWQSLRSHWRPRIRINDQPTCELDYSGFGPRALYHLEGQEFEGDPYDIPEIRATCDAQGMDWQGSVRPSIKKAFATLLNSEPDSAPTVKRDWSLPKDVRQQLYELVRAHHTAVAHRFQQGYGLVLMKRESDICQRILDDAGPAGVPVLPIHDSYVAPIEHRDWLMDRMATHYRAEFGQSPSIKEGH